MLPGEAVGVSQVVGTHHCAWFFLPNTAAEQCLMSLCLFAAQQTFGLFCSVFMSLFEWQSDSRMCVM